MEYFLRDPAGNERKLLFDSTQPEMVTGVRISLRGVDSPEGLRVTDYRLLPDEKPAQSALIDGTAYPARSFAFILIDTGSGFTPVTYMGTRNTPVTPDLIKKRMISDADSIKNYYLFDSYGRQDITNVVIGPLTYTPNGCDTSQMTSSLRAMVAECQPYFVLHLAAQSLVRLSYEQPVDTCAVNILRTVHLLDALRAQHDDWQARQLERQPAESVRRRCRALAFALQETGEDREATERQRLSWGFHPALCYESTAWAGDQLGATAASLSSSTST